MPKIKDLVFKVRSKNAGPFWVTLDIFCGDAKAYQTVSQALATETVAELFRQPAEKLKRFDITDLNVIKFSMPRPVIQGDRKDRDMHGAQWAVLLAESELDVSASC